MQDVTFLDANELVINMGPQHPATHGVLRVKLRLGTQPARGFSLGSTEEKGVFVLDQPNHLLSLGDFQRLG